MNLTSGFLFSFSVCVIILFWSEVVVKRDVFPKLFHVASIFTDLSKHRVFRLTGGSMFEQKCL